MLGDGRGRHNGHVAIDPVLILRERRDCAHGIARSEAGNSCPDGLDAARRLVTEPRGKRWRLEVLSGAEHRFGAVEAERLNSNPHFTGRRGRHVDRLDFKNFRTAGLIETYGTRHIGLLSIAGGVGPWGILS